MDPPNSSDSIENTSNPDRVNENTKNNDQVKEFEISTNLHALSINNDTDKTSSIPNEIQFSEDTNADNNLGQKVPDILTNIGINDKNINDTSKTASIVDKSFNMTISNTNIEGDVNLENLAISNKNTESNNEFKENSIEIDGVDDALVKRTFIENIMTNDTEKIFKENDDNVLERLSVKKNDNKVQNFSLNNVEETSKVDKLANKGPTPIEISNEEGDEHEDNSENEYDDEIVKDERECGDGQGDQEEVQKPLDHDEDKKNPEYIPRKGAFFEHDTRTLDDYDVEKAKIEEEIASKREKKKGKVWEEKNKSMEGKWSHDMFDETAQAPKSTQEIIDTYGYDIRNEEHAPKARRNRRYGRGPNKYTRNWEDEKAYIKTNETKPNRKPKMNNSLDRVNNNLNRREELQEEFPPLPNRNSPQGNHNEHNISKEKSLEFSDRIGMKCETPWHVPPPPPFSKKNIVEKNSKYTGGHSNHSQSKQNYSNNNGNSKKYDDSLPEHTNPVQGNRNFRRRMNSDWLNNMPPASAVSSQNNHPTDVNPSRFPPPPNTKLLFNEIEDPMHEQDYRKATTTPTPSIRGKRYSSQRQTSIPESNHLAGYKVDDVQPILAKPSATQSEQHIQNVSVYNQSTSNVSTVLSHPQPVVCQSMPSHIIFTPAVSSLIKSDYVSINNKTPVYHSNPFPTGAYQETTPKVFQPPSVAYQESTTKTFQTLPSGYQEAQPKTYQAPVYQEATQNISNSPGTAPPAPIMLPMYVNPPPPSQVPAFTNTSAQVPAFTNTPAQVPPAFTNTPAQVPAFTNTPAQVPAFTNTPAQVPTFTNTSAQVPTFTNNQAPPMVNYVPHQFPVVNIQAPPTQPEIFRTPGGMTFYSPQEQALLTRPAPRRVKSAIPIVPPTQAMIHQQAISVEGNEEELN